MAQSKHQNRHVNPLYVVAGGSLAALVVLFLLMFWRPGTGQDRGDRELFMYCAAGMRLPVKQIATEYEKEYGVKVQLQYGGSNSLLNQIEVAKIGDLYLAADDSYTELAAEKGLVKERISLAVMRPVIAVRAGNPKDIQSIDDLLAEDVRVALGNPDQAAIGKSTRQLLQKVGKWDDLEKRVKTYGVFKPTVPDVANDVKLGAVDAAVIWDSTANQYPEIDAIRTPELDAGAVRITVGVMTESTKPTSALRFARFLAAKDRGLKTFEATGYEPVDGDKWAATPELTFFYGTVNRKALEPIVESFAKREGITINEVPNGCGVLTAQMATMREQGDAGFPDMYMACDVYYMNTVADQFQNVVNISNTDIVIVVQKGNPKEIETLQDLTKEGIRVALGQPDQCTIGVLSRKLLEAEEIYDQLLASNVLTQTQTSALLVPSITTGSADAALAYKTDTLAESENLDVIPIDSPLAKAVQPYGVARSSAYKHLARRLFDTIAQSRESFETAGFAWQVEDDTPGEAPSTTESSSSDDSSQQGEGR